MTPMVFLLIVRVTAWPGKFHLPRYMVSAGLHYKPDDKIAEMILAVVIVSRS